MYVPVDIRDRPVLEAEARVVSLQWAGGVRFLFADIGKDASNRSKSRGLPSVTCAVG